MGHFLLFSLLSEKNAFCLQGYFAQTNDLCGAQQLLAGPGFFQEAPYVCQVQVPLLGLHRPAHVYALRRRPGCAWARPKRGTNQRHHIPAWQEEASVRGRWAQSHRDNTNVIVGFGHCYTVPHWCWTIYYLLCHRNSVCVCVCLISRL